MVDCFSLLCLAVFLSLSLSLFLCLSASFSLEKMMMQCLFVSHCISRKDDNAVFLSLSLYGSLFLNLDISLSLYLQNSKLEDFLNLSFFEISTTDTRLQRLQRCSMLATDKCAFSSLPVASDGQGLEFRRHRSCMLLASQPCTAHCQRLVLAQYLERISS